jgi:hypothetical protein
MDGRLKGGHDVGALQLPPIHIRGRQFARARLRRRGEIELGTGARLTAALKQPGALKLHHQGAQHRRRTGDQEQSRPGQESRHKHKHRRQPPHRVILEHSRSQLNAPDGKFLESFTHFLLTSRIAL